MENLIHDTRQDALSAIEKAYSLEVLEELRVEFLGRKGRVTELLKKMKDFSAEEKKEWGPLLHALKEEIEKKLDVRIDEFEKEKFAQLAQTEWIDVTKPSGMLPHGSRHLVSQTIDQLMEVFGRIGFTRYSAPEVDYDFFAFESLNMPPTHPARDDWETFFIDAPVSKEFGKQVLTPHTSNMQVRAMTELPLPLRLISIGRVYRRQSDASHVPMFHQVELLSVGEDVTLAQLKGTIEYFMKSFFGENRKLRFRPHHFRFTEPSFEVDIDCDVCHGDASLGCRVCKEGWLELGGAGMTHPNVLRAADVDPKQYRAFAFGFGLERITMMKSGLKIPDIRMIYENDMRFLKQF